MPKDEIGKNDTKPYFSIKLDAKSIFILIRNLFPEPIKAPQKQTKKSKIFFKNMLFGHSSQSNKQV